jgi:hypothetical protein
MHREEDREGRSAAPGGSGGGTQEDRWTEEDFKQRVRERLDRLEQHLNSIDQRLDRIVVAKSVAKAVVKSVAEGAVAAST